MSELIFETNEQASKQRITEASAYSARVQGAMRYDKLSSSSYSLVMTILDAVARGYTEEQWKEDHQRTLKTLSDQSTEPTTPHADLANRYEQVISNLKDLSLWPW